MERFTSEQIDFIIASNLSRGRGTNQQKLIREITKLILPMTEEKMLYYYTLILTKEISEISEL